MRGTSSDLAFDLSQAYGLWAGLIGGVFITFGSHGVEQMVIQPYLCARRLPDAKELRATRVFTAFFGLVQIGVGIGGLWLTASVVSAVLGVAAFTTGIIPGVFFLGMYAPRVGQRAPCSGSSA